MHTQSFMHKRVTTRIVSLLMCLALTLSMCLTLSTPQYVLAAESSYEAGASNENLIVETPDITAAIITNVIVNGMVAPEANMAAVDISALSLDNSLACAITGFQWLDLPESGVFAEDTAYGAQIELTANAGYTFTSSAAIDIGVAGADILADEVAVTEPGEEENTLTYSILFPQTEPLPVLYALSALSSRGVSDLYSLKITEAKVTASNAADLYKYRKTRAADADEYAAVGLGFGGDMYQKAGEPDNYYTYMTSASLAEPRQFTFETTFEYDGTFDPALVEWWHGSGGTTNSSSNKPMTATTGGSGAAWTRANYRGSGSTALFTLVGTPDYNLDTPGLCTATATFEVNGGIATYSKSQFTDTNLNAWNAMRNATTRVYYNTEEVASRPFRIPMRDFLYSYLEYSEWIDELKPQVSEWIDVNGTVSAGNATYDADDRYVALESLGKSSGFTTTSGGSFMRYGPKDIWTGIVADSEASVDYYLDTVVPTMNSGSAVEVAALKDDPDARMVIYYNNIHSDECHGSDSVMYLFQELAKSEVIYSTKTANVEKVAGGTNADYTKRSDGAIDNEFAIDIDDLLDEYIFVFNFMENPAGRDYGGRYVNYRFDPNRDGGVQALPESVASKRSVARWDPLSFIEFHSSRPRLQIDPCSAPHDPNYEADLYYNGTRTSGGMMNRQAHAMGAAVLGTQVNDSYVVPEEDISTANERFDDVGPNYSPQYAMLLGSLAVTIESVSETSRDLWANVILSYGALDDQFYNVDDYWDFKLEYKKRGVTNQNTDALVNPYLFSANKNITPLLNRQYPAGATKFFPDYYVIPMDGSQLDASQALEAVRYLTRSQVAIEMLTAPTTIGSKTYPAGTYVVDMKQGNRALANMALHKGQDSSRSGTLYSSYNVVNLPALRGFTCDWAEGSYVLNAAPANYTLSSGHKQVHDDRALLRRASTIAGDSGGYVIIKNSGLDAIRLVFAALGAAGQTAYPVKMITTSPPAGYRRGDFVMSYADYQTVNTGGNKFYVDGERVNAEPAGVRALVRPKITLLAQYPSEIAPLTFEKLGMRIYAGGPANDTTGAADVRLSSAAGTTIPGQNVIINYSLAISGSTIQNALTDKTAGLIQVGPTGMATAGGYLGTGFTRGSAGGSEGILTGTYDTSSIVTTRMENAKYIYTGSTEYLSALPTGAVALMTSDNTGTSTLDYDPASSFIAGKATAAQKANMKGKIYGASGTYNGEPDNAPVILFGDDIFNKAHNEAAWRLLGNAILCAASQINPNQIVASPDTDIGLAPGATTGSTLVSWTFNSTPTAADYAKLEYALGEDETPTTGWTALPDSTSITISDAQSRLGQYVYLRFAADLPTIASEAIKSAALSSTVIKDFVKQNQDTLSINPANNKRVGQPPFQLTVSGGSGTGALTFTQVSGTAASVAADGLVTITSEGDIVVKVTKAGDSDYNEAVSVNLTILIGAASSAKGDVLVSDWTELVAALADGDNAGKSVGLTNDIDIPSGGAAGMITADNLTIEGNGFTLTRLSGATDRPLQGSGITQLTVKDLTINGGKIPSTGNGGAISIPSSATNRLTVENCVFIDNVTTGTGGALHCGVGELIVKNSAFIGNETTGSSSGGAVYAGNMTLLNSTFYGNKSGRGGTVTTQGSSHVVTMTNCTVVNNTAASSTGGMYTTNVTTITNTIAIGNMYGTGSTAQDVNSYIDGGNNIFGTVSNRSGDAAATTVTGITYPNDWLESTPADNGGNTLTMALIDVPDSPAIRKGAVVGATAKDQRGVARKVLPDIGAYEFIPVEAVAFGSLTANGTANTVTTTELTITLDKVVAGLTASDITVTGANKGALDSTNAPVYKLAVSNITVAQGADITVALAKSGYAFTPANRNVAANVAAGQEAVAFGSLTANGTANTVTTTELTLTLDKVVAGLTASDITVTGADKGALDSTSAPVYKLAVSNITVAQGANITVALAKSGYAFTPANRNVAANVAAGQEAVAFGSLTANGTANTVATTELTLTLDKVVAGLTASDITVTGADKGALDSTSAPVYKLAVSNITVAQGANITVALGKSGYAFTPASRNVAANVAAKIISVTGITLNKQSVTMKAGNSENLTATIAPADATNKNVTWSSSDTSVAEIANGVVTAVKAGNAVITATTADGGKTATCGVTVTTNNQGGGRSSKSGTGSSTKKTEEPKLTLSAAVVPLAHQEASDEALNIVVTVLEKTTDTTPFEKIDPINKTLAKVAYSIGLESDETPKAGQLLKVEVDVSGVALTAEQKDRLTAIYYDEPGTAYKQMGGEYSDDGKTFTFYSPHIAGNYSLIVSDNLTKIRLQIGNSSIWVNNVTTKNDVAPTIQEGITLVPLRVIAETLKAEVDWDDLTRTVRITKGGKTTQVTIDRPLPNGLGTAIILNDRTFVPLRYIAEQLGANVVWYADTKTIRIYE